MTFFHINFIIVNMMEIQIQVNDNDHAYSIDFFRI